ncbi:IclR family transcriptional regulator C-terminal domain-containing protein [Nocardioides sp. NPDC006303]|uniref:IclR family transcriptional regulator n=1 Tax=Nocardioides sp. NPDC006303 TaxID=3156747 RepID=UPI0033AAF944
MVNEVPAVSAAVRLVERLAAAAPQPVSAGTLVDELGLNRSTCYNILATLQQAGWVNNLGKRSGWTLGPGLSTLSGLGDEGIHAVAKEEVEQLCRRLGVVVFACQEDGSGSYTVVAVGDPGRGVRVTVDVGDRFPFSAPGLMQAFWAYRPFEDFRDLARRRLVERFTEFTVTDADELKDVFEQVRSRGYGSSIRQFNVAHSGASATVFGPNGQPKLALMTITFSSELDEDNLDRVGAAIRDAADRITARIGGAVPERGRVLSGR